MTRVQISIKDFPQALRDLEKKIPKAVERGMRDASLMLRGALVQIAIKRADPQPVDQGQYKAAWGGRDVEGGAIVFNLTKQAFFIERGRRPGKMPPMSPIREWVRRKGLWKDRFAELKAEASTAKKQARRNKRVDRQRATAARKYTQALLGRKAWRAAEKRARASGAVARKTPRRRGALPSFAEMRGQASLHRKRGEKFTTKDRAINEVAMLIRRKIGKRGTPEKRVLRNAIHALRPKMPGILRRALREVQP